MQDTPYWWLDAGAPAAPPPCAWPGSVDVAIVGAGLTGLSAARTLARAGRSVAVLERGVPGIGASSRNGGQVGGGHRLAPAELDASYGADLATRLLHEAHLDSVAHFRQLLAETGIACDWRPCGRFRGVWNRADFEAAGRDLDTLQRRVPVEAWLVDRADQGDEIATPLYCGGTVYPRHGAINPAKFSAGLLGEAIASGARVVGQCAVNAIEGRAGQWRLQCTRGALRAGELLVATNGYTGPLTPVLRRRVVPVPSFIIATEALGANRVAALMPGGRVYVESRVRHCYFRPSADGERIVFGGRAAMFEVPAVFATRQMQGLLHQVFPDLGRPGDIGISHSWRGNTGFSFAQLPHVGQLGGAMGGMWVAMGYSGNGNTMAPYLGYKAAMQMLGEPEGETAFSRTRFEARWWHRGRPWFLPGLDLGLRARDLHDHLRRSR